LDTSCVDVGSSYGMCVVLASAGYPASKRTGDVITGVQRAAQLPGVHVYHAGTAMNEGQLVTAGGRVLAVTATGDSLEQARGRAYEACGAIRFAGMQYRRDIGYRQLGAAQR